jgi:hypothetical protein
MSKPYGSRDPGRGPREPLTPEQHALTWATHQEARAAAHGERAVAAHAGPAKWSQTVARLRARAAEPPKR